MAAQKKIIHFHPNGKFANIFVKPLIDSERAAGFDSGIVISTDPFIIDSLEIPYDLNLKNLPRLPYSFFRIINILRKEKPDIIITHNSKSSPLILVCAWLINIPTRIYFNHGVPYLGYAGLFKFILLTLEKINLLLSTRVLTVSWGMLNALKKLSGAKSIDLISNGSACGLDLSLYDPMNFFGSTLRHDYGISDDDFLVVFVGRPEVRKGFEIVINIWIKYFHSSKYKLLLCGPSDSNVIDVFGYVPNNVMPLGFINHIPEVLFQSNFLVLPSLHEGLSYSVIEAMASECLVVANKIPGNIDLIEDGVNGFLVENNDIDKYAEIIIQMSKASEAQLKYIFKNAAFTANLYSRKSFLPSYLKQLY